MAARDTEGPVTERQSIIEAYWRASAENVRAALATVVRVEGSAYRRPGARMGITETGRTSGVVSGGGWGGGGPGGGRGGGGAPGPSLLQAPPTAAHAGRAGACRVLSRGA